MCIVCMTHIFFIIDTETSVIYTLSLHDALPIWASVVPSNDVNNAPRKIITSATIFPNASLTSDRKSTRLNSSHTVISYAVFCLKKKKYLKTQKQNSNNIT